MNSRQLFTSGSFAKLARTSRNTLHLYDNIGLLKPSSRGDNNYRYYAAEQLAVVNLIRILQELGMSLEEITELKEKRTPKSIDTLLLKQIGKVDEKIDAWVSARKLLLTMQQSIHAAIGTEEGSLSIRFMPAEAIILGDLNDYSRGRSEYHALLSFYNAMQERHPKLNLNYPVWGQFSRARIEAGDYRQPDRFYFFNPAGHDKRPAAFYAVGYARGGYGETGALYDRMKAYIADNGFEICGDAYEEYPLNEVAVADPGQYLIRVMITVSKKIGAAAPEAVPDDE